MRAETGLCRFATWTLAAVVCGSAFAEQPGEFFENRVRPVLVKNCLPCHGSGVAKMGGLQLDSRDHLMTGGAHGPVLIPGDPERSTLIQAVRKTHGRFKMPPAGQADRPGNRGPLVLGEIGRSMARCGGGCRTERVLGFSARPQASRRTVSGGVAGLTDIDRFIARSWKRMG
jgi:hypothetical protein